MKKLTDILRKFGVLRFGSYSATYKNATEMPDEMFTGTFNASKETITKEDLQKVNNSLENKSGLLFIIALIISLFFFLMFLSTGLFKFWIMVGIILWVVFLLKLKIKSPLVAATPVKTILILITLIFVSFLFIGMSGDPSKSSGQSNNEVVERKVLNVKSENGDLEGVIGVETLKNGRVKAFYNMLATVELPTNWVCLSEVGICGQPYNVYTYIGDLVEKDAPENDEGTFSPAYCNLDEKVEDPFSTGGALYGSACLNLINGIDIPTTNSFSVTFSKVFDSYDEFLAADTYKVHDGSKFWYVTERDVIEGGIESLNHGVDGKLAITKTAPVKSFKLILEDL